jgi:acetyl-CoA C-acetyltransferase
MKEVVIVSAVRTPVGRFQGSLQSFAAPRLGALTVREAVRRAGLTPDQGDECIMGCVLQAGLGQNPARQAAIYAGLSPESSAFTINQVCGSGLKAIALAAQAIETGNAEIVVAGGMESMTNAPYLLPQARGGYRMGNGALVDSMILDGLWEAYNGFHMGIGAEMIAEKYAITREQQDAFSVESHRRAAEATEKRFFRDEIVPVDVPAAKKGAPPTVFSTDESIRPETSVETLARLKPAFKQGGTVTAGNSPGISDGAAALVVTSAERAGQLRLEPIAVIRAQSTSGGRASRMAARFCRSLRTQRGICCAGDGGYTRPGTGPGQSECARRRGCARASDWRQRGQGVDHAPVCDGALREDSWHCRALPGRRQRGGAGRRAGLTGCSAGIKRGG